MEKGLIFTYALTYGGAVASLFNPFVGLLVYICFAIIKPETLWHWSVPAGNYSRIVAIAFLAGWGLNGFGDRRLGRAAMPLYALVGFFLWAALSGVFAPNAESTAKFLEAMFKIVLPVVAGITLVTTPRRAWLLAWTIVVSQGYVAYDLNMSYFAGINLLREQGFASFDNNSYSIALVTGAGLAFFLGLYERTAWRRWLAFLFAGLMAHCVLFSNSRGGMLALVVLGVTTFFLIPKQPKHYAFFLLALLLGLRLAGPETMSRFSSAFVNPEERDASAQSRLDLWGTCIDSMMKRPLFGVGPDHWVLIVHEYGWPKGKEAHTLWLQLGAEVGIPGMLLIISYYATAAWRLIPLSRRRGVSEWESSSARMVLASLVGFFVSSQFVSLEGLELPYYVNLLGLSTLRLSSTPFVDQSADEGNEERLVYEEPFISA